MRTVLGILSIVAVLGLIATFAVESSYTGRAQRVQLVRIDRTKDSKFGPVTVDVGEPTMLIVGNPAALLKNKTALGLPEADADYIKSHADAAIQLKPLLSIVGIARIGCILSAAATGIGMFCLPRLRAFLMPPEP